MASGSRTWCEKPGAVLTETSERATSDSTPRAAVVNDERAHLNQTRLKISSEAAPDHEDSSHITEVAADAGYERFSK